MAGARLLDSVPRPIRWLFVADVSLGVLAVLNAVVAAELGVERSDFLRSGAEANLPTWFATVQLALVGFVLVPLAVRDVRRNQPRTWWLVLGPALFALLSLDEGAMLHERVGLRLAEAGVATSTFQETAPWLFALVPLYGLVAVAAYRSWRPYLVGRTHIQGLLASGVVLLGASAAGLEALMYVLDAQHGFMGQAMSVVEETGELVAVTLLLWGSVLLVRAEGVRVVLGHSPGRIRRNGRLDPLSNRPAEPDSGRGGPRLEHPHVVPSPHG